LDKLCRSCHGNTKGGIQTFLGFLSSNFMKICRNIHRSVWQLLGVEQIQNGGRCHGNQVQNGRQIQKSSDLGEIWFPSRL
jgi:hypothetical protein